MTVMTILFNSFLYYFLFIFFNYFHRSVTSVIKLINSLYLGIKIVTVNNKNDDRLKLHGMRVVNTVEARQIRAEEDHFRLALKWAKN